MTIGKSSKPHSLSLPVNFRIRFVHKEVCNLRHLLHSSRCLTIPIIKISSSRSNILSTTHQTKIPSKATKNSWWIRLPRKTKDRKKLIKIILLAIKKDIIRKRINIIYIKISPRARRRSNLGPPSTKLKGKSFWLSPTPYFRAKMAQINST